LLEALYRENYKCLVAKAIRDDDNGMQYIDHMYFVCKGKCDKKLQKSIWREYKETTSWKDISDLVIPAEFLRWIMATINQLRSGKYIYSETAFKKEKKLIMALSQKVFREMTESERKRVRTLISLPF
jgi:hypothetical protein